MLRRFPDALRRAAAADAVDTRLALADAAAADGSKTVLVAALPLLLDAAPSVRIAAATAFVRRFPDEMAAYDPSASPAALRAFVDKLASLLDR